MYQTGRISKAEIKRMLAYSLQSSGCLVSDIVYVDETPNVIRHSCFKTGIAVLPKQVFSIPSPQGVLSVPYYYCSVCGKVFIDSMKEE